MKRRTKRILWAALAAYVCGGLVLRIHEYMVERAASREAERWRALAASAANASTTPDDARQWLDNKGFRVVLWNPHDKRGFIGFEESSTDGEHLVVVGQRGFHAGNWYIDPVWVNVTFRFTRSREFCDIRAKRSPVAFHGTGSGA